MTRTRELPLSRREQEVLRLTAEGLRAPEVGRRLFIEASTVKYHLMNVRMKLDCKTTSQAVALALGNGLLTAPRLVCPTCGQILPTSPMTPGGQG